jgi:hypothetical protein
MNLMPRCRFKQIHHTEPVPAHLRIMRLPELARVKQTAQPFEIIFRSNRQDVLVKYVQDANNLGVTRLLLAP